ncbi:MAG: 23S rRNA (adenine(2030)-N(6))-methyltransferase RlmJ, partial [Polaromonas sp.]
MFSYRHAFHAGNHADVLKHTTLIALMKYLT